MKNALILGCSHASGAELGADSFAKINSYPALIAKLLGYSVTNLALTGGSNDAIFRLFLENVQRCDIVIVAWSGIDRSEIYHNNKWIPLLTNNLPSQISQYHQQWCVYHTHEQVGRLNKIKNIVALNSLSPVPVINCESFWPVWNYTWPAQYTWPLEDKDNFWDWACRNNYNKTQNGHFELAAHKKYAELVVENCKTLYNS